MAAKIDFKKTLQCYQAKANAPALIEVPELRYLMIDGQGDPNSQAFRVAIEALFPLAYKLKFVSKKQLDRDYVVPPLEALWWADDMSSFTTARDKSQWHWTAMIMTPDWISDEMFREAASVLSSAGAPARLEDVRLEALVEGRCVQALHVGPYDDEGPLLQTIHHDFLSEHGLQMVMQHHEIYLSDFRKTAPEKLRTILRQPVR